MSYASLFGMGAVAAPVMPGQQRGSFTIRVMHPARTPVQRRPIVVVLRRNGGATIERRPLPATGGRVVFSMPREPGTYQYDVIETTTNKVLHSGSVNFYASHLTQNKEKEVFLPTIAYTRADRKRRRKARRQSRRDRRARRRGTSGLGEIVSTMPTGQKIAFGLLVGGGAWYLLKRA